jgi:epoxyqueuosine reductase
MNPAALGELFDLSEEEFRSRFRETPLWRPHRRGLLRNAAIVLGNQRSHDAVAALTRGLNDIESIVRGASAWALGKIGSEAAKVALVERSRVEFDQDVLHEIYAALEAVDAVAAAPRMVGSQAAQPAPLAPGQ